jgi:hypothetical protein
VFVLLLLRGSASMLGRVGLGSILRVHDIYLRELPAATTIMEIRRRVSAASEPDEERPIDLVTSTATSELAGNGHTVGW